MTLLRSTSYAGQVPAGLVPWAVLALLLWSLDGKPLEIEIGKWMAIEAARMAEEGRG